MKILFILRNKNRKKQQKNVLPFTAAKIIKDRAILETDTVYCII